MRARKRMIKRVAIVHHRGDQIRQSERSALHVADVIRASGRDVLFFTPPGGPMEDIVRQSSFALVPIDDQSREKGLWGGPIATSRAFISLKRYSIDLVHCMSVQALRHMARPARLCHARLVAHIQSVPADKELHRSGCGMADLVIAPTEAIRSPLTAYLNQRKRNRAAAASLLPLFVDFPDDDAPKRGKQLRASHHLSPDEAVVGMWGPLIPRMGADLLLEAVELIARRGLRPKVWIVGDDPDTDSNHLNELRDQARSLGIGDQVRFWGAQDDKSAFLSAMDIMVVPARLEPYGLIAVEAMLGHTAVVATDTGGLPDCVRNGETGLLVPPVAPDLLSDAVFRLLVDMDARQQVVQGGEQFARAVYSQNSFADRLIGYYDRLENRGSAGEGVLEESVADESHSKAMLGKMDFDRTKEPFQNRAVAPVGIGAVNADPPSEEGVGKP